MIRTILAVWVWVSLASFAAGQAQPPAGRAEPPAISVAVLDYESTAPGNPQQGQQIADILTTRLSIEDGLVLVERDKLGKILEEQKLMLVGLVNPDEAAKVGRLTGAQLMVMGKTFVMDGKMMIITKLVGVESGRVVGGLRQVELSTPLSQAVTLLAEDVSALIRKQAPKLLPKETAVPDRIGELKKLFAAGPKLRVAVVIPEEHKRRAEPVRVPDPACETEIKKVLGECGVELVDTGRNDLAEWAHSMFKDKNAPWPAAMDSADVVIVGEAFSEFALRTGDLVTCAARAEINVIDRKTGRVIVADRETTRAVDLAENIAGKTALQGAGRKLGLSAATALVEFNKTRKEEGK